LVHRDNIAPQPDRKPLAVPMSLTRLARGGAIAAVIKLTSAGLSFLMFLAVAVITDPRQFGLYSAAFAGASLVSFFSSVGQHSAVLRFWPQYASLGDPVTAQGFMARSVRVTLGGVAIGGVLISATALLPGAVERTPEWVPLCLSAALLSVALAWSEFSSGALRAKGVLVAALLPRDVVWRALLIAVALPLFWSGTHISAVEAILLTAGLLLLAVAPQTWTLLRHSFGAPKSTLSPEQRQEFRTVTLGLWGITALPPALGQVSTLLVAGLLGAEVAGGVFVADRCTRLITLALHGMNQALAPEISSAFHNGNRAHVQRIASLTAWGSTAIALLTLAIFWLFGDLVLRIFDPAYANPAMHWVLIIFALGATVGPACGPVEMVLQMTGGQTTLFKVLVVSNLLGLLATATAAVLFGLVGAALAIAGTAAVSSLCALYVAKRRIGIDTSLLGLMR